MFEDNTLVVPLDDHSIFDRVVKTGYTYSRNVCYMVCEQLIITQICGCNSYEFSYQEKSFDLCPVDSFMNKNNTNVTINCPFDVIYNFSNIFTEFCMPRCPMECHRSFFTASISDYKYDTNYFNIYLNNFDFRNDVPNNTDLNEYAYENMIEVLINYDTFSYLEVNEEPKMSGEDLFG